MILYPIAIYNQEFFSSFHHTIIIAIAMYRKIINSFSFLLRSLIGYNIRYVINHSNCASAEQ